MNGLEISAEQFDRMLKEIRASSFVALALAAMSATRILIFNSVGPFNGEFPNKVLSIVELTAYLLCAVLIWGIKKWGAYTLLVINIIMGGVWAAVGVGWTILMTLVFALIIVRTIKLSHRFENLHAQARKVLGEQSS